MVPLAAEPGRRRRRQGRAAQLLMVMVLLLLLPVLRLSPQVQDRVSHSYV